MVLNFKKYFKKTENNELTVQFLYAPAEKKSNGVLYPCLGVLLAPNGRLLLQLCEFCYIGSYSKSRKFVVYCKEKKQAGMWD